MRLALVGVGHINVTQHTPALVRYARDVAPLTLSICDPDERRRAAWRDRFGDAPAFAHLDELLAAARPDAAVVCVPPARTCEVATRLLREGVPVFTEKPPGLTPAETASLGDAAGDVPHAVAFNRRHAPPLRRLKGLVDDIPSPGARLVSCTFTRVARGDADFGATAIHGLDALRFLGGDVASLTATVDECPGPPPHRDITLHGRFASGAQLSMTIFPVSGRAVERYTVVADGVTLEAESGMPGTGEPASVRAWRRDAGPRAPRVLDAKALGITGPDDPDRAGFYRQLEVFLNALRDGGSPGVSFAASIQTVELMAFVRDCVDGATWRGATSPSTPWPSGSTGQPPAVSRPS